MKNEKKNKNGTMAKWTAQQKTNCYDALICYADVRVQFFCARFSCDFMFECDLFFRSTFWSADAVCLQK